MLSSAFVFLPPRISFFSRCIIAQLHESTFRALSSLWTSTQDMTTSVRQTEWHADPLTTTCLVSETPFNRPVPVYSRNWISAIHKDGNCYGRLAMYICCAHRQTSPSMLLAMFWNDLLKNGTCKKHVEYRWVLKKEWKKQEYLKNEYLVEILR